MIQKLIEEATNLIISLQHNRKYLSSVDQLIADYQIKLYKDFIAAWQLELHEQKSVPEFTSNKA